MLLRPNPQRKACMCLRLSGFAPIRQNKGLWNSDASTRHSTTNSPLLLSKRRNCGMSLAFVTGSTKRRWRNALSPTRDLPGTYQGPTRDAMPPFRIISKKPNSRTSTLRFLSSSPSTRMSYEMSWRASIKPIRRSSSECEPGRKQVSPASRRARATTLSPTRRSAMGLRG
jgi:hypothetical protein